MKRVYAYNANRKLYCYERKHHITSKHIVADIKAGIIPEFVRATILLGPKKDVTDKLLINLALTHWKGILKKMTRAEITEWIKNSG